MYPGDRQYIARWLKAADAQKLGTLAPVLKSAVAAADQHTITVALDLEDVVDRAAVKLGLSVSPVVAKQKDVTLGNLSAFVCSVKGLTFTADLGERVTARITIEFAFDVLYKKFLKDLFLELLDAYDIALAGTENWEATFGQKTMTLSGPLEPADLKRLVSLFAFPRPDLDPEVPAATDQPTVGATQRYLSAVGTVLNDLKGIKEQPNKSDQNYTKTATWHEKAAAQLEQLSRRNVDPIATDAAYAVAKSLRAIAGSLRGVPVELSAANDKAYAAVTGGGSYLRPVWGPHWHPAWGGWWGGYRQWVHEPVQVQTNLQQVFEERAKAISGDKKRRIEAWGKIDDVMSEARRKLGDKYKVPF